MARRSEATREAVWEAMERLRLAGDPRWDSPMRLRIAIGSVGSFSTITQHRDAWREVHQSTLATPATSSEIPTEARDLANDAIAKAVEQAWRTARDHAAAATEDLRRKALAEMTAANRDREDAIEEAKRLERELAEAQEAMAEQRTRAVKAESLYQELASANSGLRNQIEQALIMIREHQEAFNKAQAEAGTREKDLREQMAREMCRSDEMSQQVVELRSRLAELDSELTEKTKHIAYLETELAAAKADSHASKLQFEIAEKTLQKAQSDTQDLERKVQMLQEVSTKVSEENIRLSERAKIMEDERQAADQRSAHATEMYRKLEPQLLRLEGSLQQQLDEEQTRRKRLDDQLAEMSQTMAKVVERMRHPEL